MIAKKRLFRLLFATQIACFGAWYSMGPHGMKALRKTKSENEVLSEEIVAIEKEIDLFTQRILALKTDDFYKEKIAREQLQMARKDEIVYLVD